MTWLNWMDAVKDGLRSELRAKLTMAQLQLLRDDAREAAMKMARAVFKKRGNHTEAHLGEAELAAMLMHAFEAGYVLGAGEPTIAMPTPEQAAAALTRAEDALLLAAGWALQDDGTWLTPTTWERGVVGSRSRAAALAAQRVALAEPSKE